jgi:hypothetical protein
VRQTGKDAGGDITSLCNVGQPWSPCPKAAVIAEIEGGVNTYFVDEAGDRSNVTVVDGPTGKYLRTTADSESANNLDNLPDC